MLVVWGFLRHAAAPGPVPPDPGPPWLVLDSGGTTYICTDVVSTSAGVSLTVVAAVLSSNGTSFNPI